MTSIPIRGGGLRAGGLPNPVDSAGVVRGVLFDLDGTLYNQPRMRRLMARELLQSLIVHPFAGTRRLRGLREYRRAHESLRTSVDEATPLHRRQLERAAGRAGMTPDELAPIVREWMDERPLKHLKACRAVGVRRLFRFLSHSNTRIGVFSDYPADAKLRALGLADYCSPVLSSSDPDIAALKPNPRGFLKACDAWGFAPAEVLMVGDRADVDGAGAVAAGMPCVIIASRPLPAPPQAGVVVLDSLERLHRAIYVNG